MYLHTLHDVQVGIVEDIMEGRDDGTLFLAKSVNDGLDLSPDTATVFESTSMTDIHDMTDMQHTDVKRMAIMAREGSRQLLQLSSDERSAILLSIADSLLLHESDILAVNKLDLDEAMANGLNSSILNRLKLTHGKLVTLAEGIRSIAKSDEPIGKVLTRTELTEGLVLDKITSPIGQ